MWGQLRQYCSWSLTFKSKHNNRYVKSDLIWKKFQFSCPPMIFWSNDGSINEANHACQNPFRYFRWATRHVYLYNRYFHVELVFLISVQKHWVFTHNMIFTKIIHKYRQIFDKLKFTFNKIGRKLESLCKKKFTKNWPYWARNKKKFGVTL